MQLHVLIFSLKAFARLSAMQSQIWGQVKVRYSGQDDKFCGDGPVLLTIQPWGTQVAPANTR